MGMDFIDKTKGSLKKGWDNARKDLCRADLLTRFPEVFDRSFLAEQITESHIIVGDEFTVQPFNDRLTAFRGNVATAYFQDPPDEVVRMVREGGGCATGVVTDVYALSRTVSIQLK